MQLIEEAGGAGQYIGGGDVVLDQYAVGHRHFAVLVVAGQRVGPGGERDGGLVGHGAGEIVTAFLVAHVQVADEGFFQAGQLAGHAGQIFVGVGAAVGRPDQQIAHFQQGVRAGLQVGFGGRQAPGQAFDVVLVLIEAGLLAGDAQQAHAGDGVVGRHDDALAGGHLLHQLASGGGVVAQRAVHDGVDLGVGNAHGGCLAGIRTCPARCRTAHRQW